MYPWQMPGFDMQTANLALAPCVFCVGSLNGGVAAVPRASANPVAQAVGGQRGATADAGNALAGKRVLKQQQGL